MALSPLEMHNAIIKNLPGKTGKNINEWVEVAKSIKATNDKDLLNVLKSKYQLGHFQAQTIIKCVKNRQN